MSIRGLRRLADRFRQLCIPMAVADSMLLFERDLTSAIELFPKRTMPKGVSHKQAAHLLAGALGGIKGTCANSSELREKIHASISMMIRTSTN
jgi:hypothetical protein